MTEPIDPVDSVIAAGLRGQEFHEHLAVIAEQEARAVQRISDDAGDGLTVRVTATELDLRFDLTLAAGPGDSDTEAEVDDLDHHRGMFVGDVRERVAGRLGASSADPAAALDDATRAVVRALLQIALMELFDLTDPTEEDLADGTAEFARLLAVQQRDASWFAASVQATASHATSIGPATASVDPATAQTLAVRELAWRIANDEELLSLNQLIDFVAVKLV